MYKLLIVTQEQGYLLSALKKKLEETGYEVSMSPAETDALSRLMKSVDAVYLFADEELTQKQPGLIYLKDTVVEGDIPVFVTGEPQELAAVYSVIPAHLVQKEFPRPINVVEVAAQIDLYMKTFGKDNKRKILVVDDSGAMLRNIKGWLEDKYQIILANSGAMAIKYLSTNRPDLVLLDYEMPIVDGRQVLGMIRSEVDFADIPVIFLTGKGDRESVMQVMDLKPDGYLLKTMPPDEIRRAVDEFFAKSKAQKSVTRHPAF